VISEKTKLLEKKISGDYKIVGRMLGISNQYAYQLLNRPAAKRHSEAVEALKKIIESREKLVNN
jgi:hypothetical protein